MLALFVALLAALRSAIRARLELEAEILALRHQLAVLQRQAPKRPRLGRTDRLLWVLLSRLWPHTGDGRSGLSHRTPSCAGTGRASPSPGAGSHDLEVPGGRPSLPIFAT